MVRAIVYGQDELDAHEKYRLYCKATHIPCRFSECKILHENMSTRCKQEKIKGYYNEVMEGRVLLLGMSKERFHLIYTGY